METLDGWRIAPLFDSGAAFFSRATLDDLQKRRFVWTANPFEEYPSQQLARVEDMTWYDPQMLAGFSKQVEEVLGENPTFLWASPNRPRATYSATSTPRTTWPPSATRCTRGFSRGLADLGFHSGVIRRVCRRAKAASRTTVLGLLAGL